MKYNFLIGLYENRESAFCVRLVSVVPKFFRKVRIHFSTKVLVDYDLFVKTFVRRFHGQIHCSNGSLLVCFSSP